MHSYMSRIHTCHAFILTCIHTCHAFILTCIHACHTFILTCIFILTYIHTFHAHAFILKCVHTYLHTYVRDDLLFLKYWLEDVDRPQRRMASCCALASHLEKCLFPTSAANRPSITCMLVCPYICWSAGNKDIHPNPARKVIQDEPKAYSSIKTKKLQIHSCSKFEIKNRFAAKVITHICTIDKLLWPIAIFEM